MAKKELRVGDRVRPVEGFSSRAKSMNPGIVLSVHHGTEVARVKWDGVKDAQSVWVGWLHSITSEEREKQDDRQRHHLGLAGETSKERDPERIDVSTLGDLLCDVAQLLDGWHNDGTVWSEWDESVRQRVSAALAALGRSKNE